MAESPFGGPPLELQIVPPGIDPLEFGVLQVVKEIEVEVERHGWDQPHMLWAIVRMQADLGARAVGFGFGLAFVTGLSNQERPHESLLEMARDPKMILALLHDREIPPEQLQAWVIVTEAWMVVPHDPSPEEAKRVSDLAEARQLHAQPDRKEVRSLTAVDRAERTYMVARMRGQTDDERMAHTTDQAGDHAWLGDIPDGVLALMRATP